MLGRGEPSKQTPPLAPLDEEALEAAISLTEEAVKQAGAKLTADKKAKIALFIYKRIADKPENKDVEADLSNVISLVKLAV